MNALLLTLVLAQTPVDEKPAPPTLTLPSQVQVQPGRIFVVKATNNLKWMRWTIPAGLERVPPEDTAYGEGAFVGYGPAGVYEFFVCGTLNDQYAEAKCVVFIGQPAPLPPAPGPLPPIPPTPPNDPFLAELQRLYTLDASPAKAMHKTTLTSIYTTAATAAIKDPAVTTASQLFAKLRSVSQLLLPDDALRPIRETLAEETAKQFNADIPLTPETRAKASALFDRYAQLLTALK